jgi:DNA-binding transcriptional regulator YiaG
MPETNTDALAERPPGKPFPWVCPHCGTKTVWPVYLPYQTQVRYEGQLYPVSVPRLNVPRCATCGEVFFDNWADDQVRLSLRAELHLLSPEQIRANRAALGLSRAEFAAQLSVGEEALRRWEEEAALPPRPVDLLMRLYFALPPVRFALLGEARPELGERVVA